ncbi:DUF5132 domain-containing protein [Nitrospira sp. Nam74]
MSLFEDLPKSWFSSSIVAVGAILMAPTVIPALGSALRPLAKVLVKNGITVYDSAKELIAEAGEELNDMVAEARAEMEQESQLETSRATETPTSGRAEEASRESGGRASTGRREGQKA